MSARRFHFLSSTPSALDTALGFVVRNAGHLLILTFAVVSGIIRLLLFPDRNWSWHLSIFCFLLVLGYVFWLIFSFFIRWLDDVLPFEEGVGRRVVVQISLSILGILLFQLTMFQVFEHLLPLRLNPLLFTFIMTSDVLFAITLNVVYLGAQFFQNWQRDLVKNERLQREAANVRFDNLRNQLNPHFLFNSLTSLNSLIHEDQALASQFLQQLSRVYRYVLQHKDDQLVSLATELEFIHNYLFLLRTRFGPALEITIDIPPQSQQCLIAPVTLQILIENAIKHNRMTESNPLRLRIDTTPDAYYLRVANNLQAKQIVESSNRTGLDNMRALYSFYSEHPVLVERTEAQFSVLVPLCQP